MLSSPAGPGKPPKGSFLCAAGLEVLSAQSGGPALGEGFGAGWTSDPALLQPCLQLGTLGSPRRGPQPTGPHACCLGLPGLRSGDKCGQAALYLQPWCPWEGSAAGPPLSLAPGLMAERRRLVSFLKGGDFLKLCPAVRSSWWSLADCRAAIPHPGGSPDTETREGAASGEQTPPGGSEVGGASFLAWQREGRRSRSGTEDPQRGQS